MAYVIIGCIVLIGFMAFTEQVRFILKIIVQGIIGGALIFIANLLLTPTGISVGVNIFTTLIVGILGVPGFIAIYIARLIL